MNKFAPLVAGFLVSSLTMLIAITVVYQLAYSDEPPYNSWGTWAYIIIFLLPLVISVLYRFLLQKATSVSETLTFYLAAIAALPITTIAFVFVITVISGGK